MTRCPGRNHHCLTVCHIECATKIGRHMLPRSSFQRRGFMYCVVLKEWRIRSQLMASWRCFLRSIPYLLTQYHQQQIWYQLTEPYCVLCFVFLLMKADHGTQWTLHCCPTPTPKPCRPNRSQSMIFVICLHNILLGSSRDSFLRLCSVSSHIYLSLFMSV